MRLPGLLVKAFALGREVDGSNPTKGPFRRGRLVSRQVVKE